MTVQANPGIDSTPIEIETIEELTEEYQEWLDKTGLPKMSADELYVQTVSDDSDEHVANEEQRIWLYDFNLRWEKAEEQEA